MTSRPVRLVSRVSQFKRLLLASAALAPALLYGAAQAATITINTATTDPLKTSTVDGGNPGDILIDTSGSITLTSAAQPALTLDSDNTITNKGSVKISDLDGSIGYLIEAGTEGTFTHNGQLELGPTITPDEGERANYKDNKVGLLLESGGAFTGDIFLKTGNFAVRGDKSFGVDLQGHLIGDLDMTGGAILIQGDQSTAMRILAPVTGDVTTGSIAVVGIDSSGVRVLAPITGSFTHVGIIQVTGYDDLSPDAEDDENNDNDVQAAQQGGPGIAIGDGIQGGLLLSGPSPEDLAAVENDDLDEEDLPPTSVITVQSGANAVLISPKLTDGAGGNIGLGLYGTGEDAFGFISRGNINATGIYDGIVSEAIRIKGATIAGIDYHTTISGGLRNDGKIASVANKANAIGITIGNLASVPQILNTGDITANVTGNGAVTSITVNIEAGANVPELINSGLIGAGLAGNDGDAIAIMDTSGTLTTITNTGVIGTVVAALDDGDDDNGEEVATGTGIAFDLSATSNDITVTNDVPDDFDPDTDAASKGIINGEMRFGSGSDTLRINAGRVTGKTVFGDGGDLLDAAGGSLAGDIAFGAGADILRVRGGATVTGAITDSDGQLTLDIQRGTLKIASTDTIHITGATFGADTVLGITADTSSDEMTRLTASGNIVLSDGAKIEPIIEGNLVSSITGIILSGVDVDVQGGLSSLVSEETLPFLYSASITKTTAAGKDNIRLTLTRKNADELNIQPKLGGALDPLVRILPNDTAFDAQFLDISSQAEFDAAYMQLLPSYSDAMLAVEKQASLGSGRQIRQRLEGVLTAGGGGGAWGSESIYQLDRDETSTERGYDAEGAVLNVGLDDHLSREVILGINFGLDHGSYTENGDFDDAVSMRRWVGGIYGGARSGAMLFSASGQVAYASESVDRVIKITNDQGTTDTDDDTTVSRTTHGEWNGWRYSADVAASHYSQSGKLYFIPTIGANYLHVSEDGYTESGGFDSTVTDPTAADNSVALEVDARSGDAAVGYAELVIGYALSGRQQLVAYQQGQPYVLRPELRVAYAYDLLSDPIDTTASFVGDPSHAKFTIPSDDRNQQTLIAGVGATYETAFGSFGFDVNGEFGDNTTAVIGKFNAAFRF